MCGIGGIYRSGKRAVDKDALQRMMDSLHHRGPDDHGLYARGSIGLAHTRLSIIDPSPHGHQPMLSDDGAVALAYNGEVYNFGELRKTLECAGQRFRGHSDTEVVLRAYLQWGSRAFSRLNGMFAFALWDGHQQRLYLVRDPFGVKPLYFRHAEGELSFGSEVKAILAAGGPRAQADVAGLHEFLYFGTALGRRTMFEGIAKLPPGHALAVDEKGMRCTAYSSIPNPARSRDDFQTATKTVRSLVGEAIRSHLVSDRPVGVFLSGGIDSSAITAFASEYYEDRLKTFTIGFGQGDDSGDLSAARRVAEHFGTDHHEVDVDVEQVADVVERLVRCHDQPFGDPADIALFLLSKQVGGDAKVILQGDGGDEMFGGYRRHALMSHLVWWRLFSKGTSGMHRLLERLSGEDAVEVTLDALADSDVGMLMARLLATESPSRPPTRVLSRDLRERLLDSDPFAHNKRLHGRFADYDVTRRLIALDASITLPDLFFEKVDKPTMHHGIEVRVPMVDRNLASYAMSLPSNYRVRGRNKKVVLRAALRGIVPDSILDRPKAGLNVPMAYWLRTSLADYAKSVLLDSATRQFGIFDQEAVARCFKEHCDGSRNNERLVYKLLSLALWCHAYRPRFDDPRASRPSHVRPSVDKPKTRRRAMFIVSGLERGGAETQLVGLANGLAGRSWNVTVVSYSPLSEHSLAPELRAAHVRTITLNVRSGLSRYASIVRAALVVRQTKPDVLVGVMFHGIVTARLLGRLLGIRNVSSIHSERHGQGRERLLRLTRTMTDAVVALSPGLGHALVRCGVAKRSHTIVVPNSVNTDLFTRALSRDEARAELDVADDRFLWLAAGRLEVEKDYPTMLHAFRAVARRHREATLIIAGVGSQEASLRRLIERLGLSNRVRLVGLRTDIPNLLSASDAFVLSSAWEGMPVVVLEAIAGRRPIVATSVGAIPDLIQDGRSGLLVQPNDSIALAGAMERAMGINREATAALVNEAHERVRTMCSEAVVLDSWEAILEQLLDTGQLINAPRANGPARRDGGAARRFSLETGQTSPRQ